MSKATSEYLQSRWSTIYAGLTMLVDAVSVVLALAIGYALNFAQEPFGTFLYRQWKLVVLSVALYIFLGALFGAYRQSYNAPARVQLSASAKAYLLGTLIIFATLFLYRNTYYSQGAPATYLLIFPAVYLSLRSLWWFFRLNLHNRKWAHERSFVLLMDAESRPQVNRFDSYPLSGYDLIDSLQLSEGWTEGGPATQLRESIRRSGAQVVLVAASSFEQVGSDHFLSSLVNGVSSVRLLTPEIHTVLSRLRLYDLAGIAYEPSHGQSTDRLHRWGKRLIDLLLGSLLLIILSPLLAAIAVAIKLESPGKVLFRQVRALSRDSDRILLYKFRSMTSGREEIGEAVDEANGTEDILFKSKYDPRRTRVGRIIRKFSLDEIPQLFNVVKGEMTLVGPRPLPINDFDRLPRTGLISDLYLRRTAAKAGITGLWQISGRSGLSFRDMVILDLYYAENQTLLFDLEILLHTIPATLSGRGAY